MTTTTTTLMFSSKDMAWCTPKTLFDRLHKRYAFTLDAAASDSNTLCEKYFTEDDDGLSKSWAGETVFCNPPYGREIRHWVKKAHDESKEHNIKVVLLIPARTDTSYWHDYIFDKAAIYFIRGRISFTNESGDTFNSAPFPSALVVYDPSNVSKMPFTTIDDIMAQSVQNERRHNERK